MPVTRQNTKLAGQAASSTPMPVRATINAATIAVPAAIKQPPADLPIHAFPDAAAFEEFLEEHHLTSPGIHLKLAKKASGIPSITQAEAVEVALCFGWIDSQANAFDDKYYLARCTPRRNKSLWSRKNVNTVARLLEEERMRPAGVAAVDAAKADGRWERAYAGPKDVVVPDDFKAVLEGNEAAKAFFEALNKSERYAVLWRIETASPTARAGRIKALVEGLAVEHVPGEKGKVGKRDDKNIR
ncbi:hypothetical protein H2198_010259 [Neophaeococcomyces mojaviensis]|uniref:Uncharacterized protein n=1 Tax=Neophaeococcomyces mojaviensis TaxID=3383035 RepID=A0ACC2ZSN2_9EURO|nr:hypothetical protein H2198_010259 [Knufia sp. JES_112]